VKIGFISLGCAKALVDTEIMMGVLKRAGHSITPSLEEAEVVVINTCAFLKEARKESEETIREVLKADKRVVVAGCYVNLARKALEKKFPSALGFLETEGVERIGEVLRGKTPKIHGLYLPTRETPRLISTPPAWAYVKISEGCSRKCTFCIIPGIRGPYRSRPVEDIVREVKELEEGGFSEVNLISQDTVSFGADRGESLGELLEALLKKTERIWIRLLYLYPSGKLLEILPLFREPRLLPYFDIPFQHSHPGVLRAMGRPWDGEKYLELIEEIRRRVKDPTLRTSLIVGFPTEGPGEFQHLKGWLKKARIDRVGVFKYSRERGSGAYPLGDPVPEEEKEKRLGELMEVQEEISREKLRSMVGQEVEVVVEGRVKEGIYFARSRHFAPEVDGGIYVLGEIKGPRAKVKITHAHSYDLEAQPL